MRRPRAKQDTFWVSYSDLATGLMLVFMVVTLITVALMTRAAETQQESVRKIVVQLRVILNTRSRLADSIRQAFGDESGVDADPITAQLDVDESKIKFSLGEAVLLPESKEFLFDFTPRYLCAIWHHEQTSGSKPRCEVATTTRCPRLDPDQPGGVRQIEVSGHADRYGAQYQQNHSLSAVRAEVVVQYMVRVLACAAGEAPGCWERVRENLTLADAKLPEACAEHEGEVLSYAQERLWAIGTGDSEHCQKLLSQHGWTRCYEPQHEREDADERKVTFGLQVTGDDMTGLLQHVDALQHTVGLGNETSEETDSSGDSSSAHSGPKTLSQMTAFAAMSCWDDLDAYHGCDEFLRGCLSQWAEQGQADSRPHCASLQARREEPHLAAALARICSAEPAHKGCLEGAP